MPRQVCVLVEGKELMERIKVVTRVFVQGCTDDDFEVTGTCTGEWLEPGETVEQAIRSVAERALTKALDLAGTHQGLQEANP